MTTARTLPRTVPAARRAWTGLPAPDPHTVTGRWEASFFTPLRTVAPLGLGLIGLPRWFGKQLTPTTGTNLVRDRAGTLSEVLPMRLSEQPSWADGGPTLVAGYAEDAPRPWRWVRDELRVLDDGVLLGLTFTDAPGLRRAGLPFLLTREG